MKVTWKYDPLFSFQVYYSGNLDPDDFKIKPTNSCSKLLAKHHLTYKTFENGGMVISEKRIYEDESLDPVYKINRLTSFNFVLKLQDHSLISHIRPYNSGAENELPEYYGKSGLLYFSNLGDNLEIDQGITPIPGAGHPTVEMNELEIAADGTTGIEDFASLVHNDFNYARKNGVIQLVLKPLRPIPNNNIVFNLTPQKPLADISLDTGAYEFEQVGGGNPVETIFAGSELFGTSLFGVIQIYKNESTDYTKAVRYNIRLEQT